jgi:hypothetical protein
MDEREPLVVYCAGDLLWATKIKSTAEALGIACRPTRDVAMLEARLADSRVVAALVDLESGAAGRAIVERLRGVRATGGAGGAGGAAAVWGVGGVGGVKVVVFGPHVDVEGLRWAKAAGADAVMARGALHAGLPGVLRALVGNERVPDQLED